MKYLAIIPARGGSKRVHKKNIKLFLGQPIIKYSIDAAIRSELFDEIMVSTDDKKIAGIAESYGAKIPFMRSKETSDDFATLADVIQEVLMEYKKRKIEFTAFCCILPTAVFIKAKILLEGLNILKKTNADSVIPIVKFSYPVQRALKIKNGLLSMIRPENYIKRSQDLETLYHDAGQFYWVNAISFLRQKRLFMNKTLPIEISDLEVQDIDDENDWKTAEIKYKIKKSK